MYKVLVGFLLTIFLASSFVTCYEERAEGYFVEDRKLEISTSDDDKESELAASRQV